MTAKIVLSAEYRLRRKLRLGFKEKVELTEVLSLLEEVLSSERKAGAQEALRACAKHSEEVVENEKA